MVIYEPMRTYRFATPLGDCALSWSDIGLTKVRFVDADPSAAALTYVEQPGEVPPPVMRWADMLRGYFRGDAVDFSAEPLDSTGISARDTAIYSTLRKVKHGEVTTYGELAALAGYPGQARAVGTTMARNPWLIIVPCHRVLAKNGALGGFSAPGGVTTKRRLLMLEGVEVADMSRQD